jgi:glucose dehydrogenase
MSANGRQTANGVANSSDIVERNLMDHPYYAWGLTPEPAYPYRGPLITSGIGDLCDGPFRNKRAAFRIDIGNEGWTFVVGGDPNVTAFDFINGLNKSRLNPRPDGPDRERRNEVLFGKKLVEKLSNVLFTPQFRIGFLVEQTPDLDSRVALSDELTDGLGLLTATDRRRGGLRATLGRYCSSVEVPDALPRSRSTAWRGYAGVG